MGFSPFSSLTGAVIKRRWCTPTLAKRSKSFPSKFCPNILLPQLDFHSGCSTWPRVLPSYLCVPPSRNQDYVSILTPHFNLDLSTDGLKSLVDNVNCRKMNAVDAERLAADWDRRTKLKADLQVMEDSRKGLYKEIGKRLQEGSSQEDVAPIYQALQRVKADQRVLAKSLHELEEVLMPRVLSLPNAVHPSTPLVLSRIRSVNGSAPSFACQPVDHSELMDGLHGKCYRSSDGLRSYYRHQFALAELATLDYFADVFIENGFEPFSNPDLCKPIVLEGCGYDIADPDETFHLKEDSDSGMTPFHLVGSASLPSFCAYFAKCSVRQASLPLKLFAAGRQYNPPKAAAECLNPVQSSQLHFFTATRSVADENDSFSSCIEILQGAFRTFQLHFRMVDVSAAELSPAESRRTELRLWLPSKQVYRTVASVASYGDFISKRLLMCSHGNNQNTHRLLRVIHGTGVSYPQFLACLLENRQDTDGAVDFPPSLLAHMANY